MTHILGFDPGFASFGFAVAKLTKKGMNLVECGVYTTTKGKGKILQAEDNMRRAQILAGCLDELCKKYKPFAATSEGMSYPQFTDAALKLALAWGAMAGVLQAHDLALVQTSPQNMKKMLCGKRNASKVEVQDALYHDYPKSKPTLMAVPKTKREHAADAWGSIVCARETDVIRLARKFS